MIFDNERPVPKPEARNVLAGGDVERICRMLVAVAFYEKDREWAEVLMLDASRHGNEQVAGLAVVCLGHLARIHGQLSPAAVQRVREGCSLPALAGSASDALEDILIYAPGSLSAAGGKCEETTDER